MLIEEKYVLGNSSIKVSDVRALVRRELVYESLADIHPQGMLFNDESNGSLNAQKTLQRIYNSPVFRSKAQVLYGNLSVPIHIVPVYKMGILERNDSATYNLEQSQQFFEKVGMPNSTISDLISSMQKGHAIFVPQTTRVQSGFLPSAWMIVHAMFDAPNYNLLSTDGIHDLFHEFELLLGHHFDYSLDRDEHPIHICDILTMKSARDGVLEMMDGDIFPEIMTQSILDKRGFQYKPTNIPEIDRSLEDLKNALSSVRPRFEKLIAGKMITVDVF